MTANRWEFGLLIGLAGKLYQNCHVKEKVDSQVFSQNFQTVHFFGQKASFIFGEASSSCAPHP